MLPNCMKGAYQSIPYDMTYEYSRYTDPTETMPRPWQQPCRCCVSEGGIENERTWRKQVILEIVLKLYMRQRQELVEELDRTEQRN
jgi:hypothetical protein